MTATDELRKMLDERGVKWWQGWDKDLTDYDGAHGVRYEADATLGLMFIRSMLSVTPEQAIEATLGRGTTTRHGKFRTKYGRSVPVCEQCGYGIGDERWHFCPSCGAEVVE